MAHRRTVLRTAGAALAGGSLAGCLGGVGVGGGGTLKVGVLNPMSGPISPAGVDAKRGADIVVPKLNEDGGINGHEIEVVYKDTQATPDVGVKRARQLVQQEDVNLIIGIVSSAVAKAVTQFTASQDIPILITAAQTPDIVKKQCAETTIRITTNIIHQQRTTAAAIDKLVDDGLTKVAGINPDYVYGHQSWEIFKKAFKKRRPDAEFINAEFPGFQKGDYKKEIQATLDAEPDIVHSVLYAGDMITFVKQANQFDFFEQFPEFYMDVTPMQVTQPLGDAVPEGAIAIADTYFRYPDLPQAKEFAKEYMNEYSDVNRRIPTVYSYETQAAWTGLKAAIERSGGISTDDIISGFKGLSFESAAPKMTVRKGDHQAIHDTYLSGRIGPIDGVDAYGFKPNTMTPIPKKEFADQDKCEKF